MALNKRVSEVEDEKEKVEKKFALLMGERDKMKQRILKLKNRKGKVDQGIKMCKNCGREFHNENNFNWSCRVHRTPEYGGEMWWCCGKRGADVPGCKFSRHETKEDDDDEDDEDKERNKAKQLKSIRCQCCKELGHTIEYCYRDPNLKT